VRASGTGTGSGKVKFTTDSSSFERSSSDYINNEVKRQENENIHKGMCKPSMNTTFIEWFVGLCEAESNFLIRGRKNKEGEIVGFEFVFRIYLHKDDRKVLEYINNTLGCGRLNTERNVLVFTISQLSDIETILIPLFEKFPLNTTKNLDYLNFKKAFFMFKNRKSSALNLPDLYQEILVLKDTMNEKRKDFSFPDSHSVRITGNYLVGLLEGDGSFYLNKQDVTVRSK
jgi:hypothetical protein